VLAILAGAAALGFSMFRRLYSAEVIAAMVYAATSLPMFAIRGDSFEIRYFGTLGVLVGLLVGAGFVEAVRLVRSRIRRRDVRLVAVVASGILVVGAIARVAWPAVQQTYTTFAARIELEAIAREADARFARGRPVVVGTKPYYYTRVTGASALSIPWSSDDYLESYMKKYGASYLILTEEEQAFWRPNWKSPPSFLQLEGRIGSAYIYRRVTSHE